MTEQSNVSHEKVKKFEYSQFKKEFDDEIFKLKSQAQGKVPVMFVWQKFEDTNQEGDTSVTDVRSYQTKNNDIDFGLFDTILLYECICTEGSLEGTQLQQMAEMIPHKNYMGDAYNYLKENPNSVYGYIAYLFKGNWVFRLDIGVLVYFCNKIQKPTSSKSYADNSIDFWEEEETEEERLEREEYEREREERKREVGRLANILGANKEMGIARNTDHRVNLAIKHLKDELEGKDEYFIQDVGNAAQYIFDTETLPNMVRRLLEDGKKPKEIADELGLTLAKAKKYIASVS